MNSGSWSRAYGRCSAASTNGRAWLASIAGFSTSTPSAKTRARSSSARLVTRSVIRSESARTTIAPPKLWPTTTITLRASPAVIRSRSSSRRVTPPLPSSSATALRSQKVSSFNKGSSMLAPRQPT